MVNIYQTYEVNVIVKAISKSKAEDKAVKECYEKGYFFANVISCEEMDGQ